MKLPPFARRHPALRWLAPAGILALGGAATVAAVSVHSAVESVPNTSASALVSAVRAAQTRAFSGTILAQMSLGLPQADADTAPSQALLSGAHTLRYWYGGADRQRVALLAPGSETDIFHVGSEVWLWDSASHTATHSVLAPGASQAIGALTGPAPLSFAALTPQHLADEAIASIDARTTVEVSAGGTVADRATYQLELRPTDGTPTRVGSVRIAVDSKENVPLGVQIYPRGAAEPAVDVAFTSVTFKTPGPEYFQFTPPPGASVARGMQPVLQPPQVGGGGADAADPLFAGRGSGWGSVSEYRTQPGTVAAELTAVPGALRAVSGSWGTGRLLDTTLVCMLVTDDGRVFTGEVSPEALYAAAGAGG